MHGQRGESFARIDDGLAAAPVFEREGDVVRLLGSTCEDCGAVAFPRRAVCLACGAAHVDTRLSGAGRVHSWTRLVNPPHGFDSSVLYGCVDLEEGPRILALLAGAQPRIGARVQAARARARHGAEGFAFELLDA